MHRGDLEDTLAELQSGYDSIEGILADDSLSCSAKLSAIEEIVFDEDDADGSEDEEP